MDYFADCKGDFVISILDVCYYIIPQNVSKSIIDVNNECNKISLQLADYSSTNYKQIIKFLTAVLNETMGLKYSNFVTCKILFIFLRNNVNYFIFFKY